MTTTAPPSPATRQAIRTFDDLPDPRGVPIFGNLLQVEPSRLHLQMARWCEEYGPMFRLRLGSRRLVVVGDHERQHARLDDLAAVATP